MSPPHRVLAETWPPPSVPLRPGVRIAIDIGSARIGVARCDPAAVLASPLGTVARGAGDVARLALLAAEHGAVEIIVGLPTGLSGQHGKAAAAAREFAVALADRVSPTPVRLVDERFTTVLAHDALRRGGRDSRQRRSVVDQAAAALLLQHALDFERETGRPAGAPVSAAGSRAAGSRAAGSRAAGSRAARGNTAGGSTARGRTP